MPSCCGAVKTSWHPPWETPPSTHCLAYIWVAHIWHKPPHSTRERKRQELHNREAKWVETQVLEVFFAAVNLNNLKEFCYCNESQCFHCNGKHSSFKAYCSVFSLLLNSFLSLTSVLVFRKTCWLFCACCECVLMKILSTMQHFACFMKALVSELLENN